VAKPWVSRSPQSQTTGAVADPRDPAEAADGVARAPDHHRFRRDRRAEIGDFVLDDEHPLDADAQSRGLLSTQADLADAVEAGETLGDPHSDRWPWFGKAITGRKAGRPGMRGVDSSGR